MPGVRRLQWAGVLLVACSAFWPTYHFRTYPLHPGAPAWNWMASLQIGTREVPAGELGTAVVRSVRGPEVVEALWAARRWYPWYLAPLWALALLAAAGPAARRRLAGAGLLVLTSGLIAFEAAYLRADYLAFLPGRWGRVELVAAWFLVVGLLLFRRRADRGLAAVEAAVAAQALLGFVHGVTLPATLIRAWLPDRDPLAVVGAVAHNFTAAFWVGMAGLLLVALPVYLRASPAPRTGTSRVDS